VCNALIALSFLFVGTLMELPSVLAAHELGVHFELGVGCRKNPKDGSKWYQCAAKASILC
jgi:TPR repeat protein